MIDDKSDINEAQAELDDLQKYPEKAIEGTGVHPTGVPPAPKKPVKPATLTEGSTKGGNGAVKPKKKLSKDEKRGLGILVFFVFFTIAIGFTMYQCSQLLQFQVTKFRKEAIFLDAKEMNGNYLTATQIPIYDEHYTLFEDLDLNYSEMTYFQQQGKVPVDVYYHFRNDGQQLRIIIKSTISGETLFRRLESDKDTIQELRSLLKPPVKNIEPEKIKNRFLPKNPKNEISNGE